MAFNAYGFKTLTHIGSVDGSAGSNRALHAYVSNDDQAAIETANYFDTIISRLHVGDIILVSWDMDSTPGGAMYVVSSTTTHVAVTMSTATADA
jgi:hypothetical protein